MRPHETRKLKKYKNQNGRPKHLIIHLEHETNNHKQIPDVVLSYANLKIEKEEKIEDKQTKLLQSSTFKIRL